MNHRGRRGSCKWSARGRQRWNREPTRHLTEAATPPQHPVDSFRVSHSNVADFWPSARSFNTGASSTDGSGGYDYEFVSEPPDELKCSVCLLALRDPSLTSCCGKHFCQSCISRIKNEGKPCPLCQEKDYQLMLDKSIIRRVRELKIKCPNSGRGCEWAGELGSIERHLDVSCGFVEVTCDYCKSEDILRNSLADHKKVCPARPYRCEYCGFRDKWQSIMSVHQSECKNYPVDCPNNCNVGTVQRHELDKHVREECTLREVGCKFECVGCQVCCPQMHIARHLSENVSSHLGMVVSHFQNKLAEKDKEIGELRMCSKTQSRQLSALTADVQSQKKHMKELEANTEVVSALVQSQVNENFELRANIQSQKDHIQELEANIKSCVRAREKLELEVSGMHSIFYVQILQLLKDIASRNHDIRMSNSNRNEVRIGVTILGAASGALVGGALVGGALGGGALVGSAAAGIAAGIPAVGYVGGSFAEHERLVIGATVVLGGAIIGAGIAYSIFNKPASIASITFTKMDEKKKQHIARIAIQVAREHNLDFVEHLLARTILDNPVKARSFLLAVLKRLNYI